MTDSLPATLEESHAELTRLRGERDWLAARADAAEAEKRELAAARSEAEAERRRLERAKAHAEAEVERYRKAIKDLLRRQHGRRSERLDPEQFRLALDDLEENLARAEAELQSGERARPDGRPDDAGERPGGGKPRRNQGELPGDLPRIEEVVEPAHEVCPCCGGALHVIDEAVTEQLEVAPAEPYVKVVRRPKYGCRACERAPVQAEAPASPVHGGLPTCGTVAQVLTAKYIDGLPLHRQREILARSGVELDTSTLARWAGAGARHLRLVYDALFDDVMASAKLFADETPAPTLESGRRTTRKAYLWGYARDDRAWNGPDPPAIVYCYAAGRGRQHPAGHLKDFSGILQVDGYRAYDAVAARRATGELVLAQCWSHARRPIHEVYQGGDAPTAEEALRWIRQLYAVEDEIRGCDPETRRKVRREKSRPLLAAFHAWLEARLAELPPKSKLAGAFKRIRASWAGLTVFLDDGRVELDTNLLEMRIRNIAVGRKAFLFAGNSGGGHTWAVVASIVQTCRMNGVDPQAYLSDVLERIASGRAMTSDLPDLLPWNWTPGRAAGRR